MIKAEEHSTEVAIPNRLGFHVRPVQRFAELAKVFSADVTVELRGREVPGKSVMNLMSLGGRSGDRIRITARGRDARQAVEVLRFLAENSFFVEDELNPCDEPQRHMERLARLASCFQSEIVAEANGDCANAKELEELLALELVPTSRPKFRVQGADAEQARQVLDNLVRHCFYVEEELVKKGRKGE
jgi:phosphotransferase system HPr (HPr) family protein